MNQEWHPEKEHPLNLEISPSDTGATSLGGLISESNSTEDSDCEIDPYTVNPFPTSEGLEFTKHLGPDWGKPKYPTSETFPLKADSGIHLSTKKSSPVLTRLSDIVSKPISWLWPGRIALGKLTIISGDPGLGKSLLTTTIAAVVSKGYNWPLEEGFCQIGSVILLSAEDDPADTIKPRLVAAGADCERIHILQIKEIDSENNPTERLFSLKRDIAVLEETLFTLSDCRLIVIDPISAYLDGTESHKNSDVRGLLAPLAQLASNHDVSIVLVNHLNKNSGGSAMYRSMGSMAFVAAARASYMVAKDKNNSERRLVISAKNNLAKENTGLAYSVIEAENGYPVLVWEKEAVSITADEALTSFDSNEEKTGTDWAIDFLEDELSDGPVPVAEINKNAKQLSISQKCLRRAREKLKVTTRKGGFEEGYIWSLPGHEDAQEYEDAQSQNVGTLGIEGRLRNEKVNMGNSSFEKSPETRDSL